MSVLVIVMCVRNSSVCHGNSNVCLYNTNAILMSTVVYRKESKEEMRIRQRPHYAERI